MNLISTIIGVVCGLMLILALIPVVGLLNYVIIPSTILGAILGAFGKKKVGLIINVVVCIFSFLRLLLLPF